MKPHEERIAAEKNELHARLIKLDQFIGENEEFDRLPDIDRGLLEEQREHMANYLEVLHLRIERFR